MEDVAVAHDVADCRDEHHHRAPEHRDDAEPRATGERSDACERDQREDDHEPPVVRPFEPVERDRARRCATFRARRRSPRKLRARQMVDTPRMLALQHPLLDSFHDQEPEGREQDRSAGRVEAVAAERARGCVAEVIRDEARSTSPRRSRRPRSRTRSATSACARCRRPRRTSRGARRRSGRGRPPCRRARAKKRSPRGRYFSAYGRVNRCRSRSGRPPSRAAQ